MENTNSIFLLTHAVEIKPEGTNGVYDTQLQLKTVSTEDKTPWVISSSAPKTHSKTFHEPVDDDPDPDRDICY